jgi:hypothetical protein
LRVYYRSTQRASHEMWSAARRRLFYGYNAMNP